MDLQSTIGHGLCVVTGLGHEVCLGGSTRLIWQYVVADGATALAYFTGGPVLYVLFRRSSKEDVVTPYVVYLVGLFIVLCGASHAFSVITLRYPWFIADLAIRYAMAAISWLAVIEMARRVWYVRRQE